MFAWTRWGLGNKTLLLYKYMVPYRTVLESIIDVEALFTSNGTVLNGYWLY